MEKREQANWNRGGRRYTLNVDNAPSPGEIGFGFRSPIRLHLGQAESIPHNWADIQKSDFYEEWLNAMRLELDWHIEIGTFSAGVVPKGVNVITAKWVFVSKTDSDGYITKAKAKLVARTFGQQLGVDYFNMFAPTPTVSSIKVALAIAVRNGPLYHFDVSCSGKTRRRRLHEISVRLRGEDRKGG